MDSLKSLQKNAGRLEELRATKTELEGLGAQLQGEAERLAKSLENVDPRVLLQVQPDGKHLPADDAARLERLSVLREKISLLPGVRANVERKEQILDAELEGAYHEACADYRSSARAKLDRELMIEIERNLPRCGGDARRAALAAKAALEHSELKLWAEWFGTHRASGDIVGRVRQLVEQARRFDAGEPVRVPEPKSAAAGPTGE
jgi:hypothetical protein